MADPALKACALACGDALIRTFRALFFTMALVGVGMVNTDNGVWFDVGWTRGVGCITSGESP